MKTNDDEYTWVEDDICVCDNCGAYAPSKKEVKHHKTCRPGESKRWEKIYSQEEDE